MIPDAELRRRNRATLLASFALNARGSRDARIVRAEGVTAAVFTTPPESEFYNNAVLDDGLDDDGLARAQQEWEAAYGRAGVAEFAVWITEGDARAERFLTSRGYRFSESTLAMSADLAALPPAPPAVPGLELRWGDWDEYLVLFGLGPDFLARADRSAYRVLMARLDGVPVAQCVAIHHEGDAGVFNVETIPSARRRGIGTTLTHALLDDAVARGCTSASLQSTPMGEHAYAAAGFRPLDRYREFVPAR